MDIILQRFVFKCYYFPTGNSICQPKQPSYSVCIITIFSITIERLKHFELSSFDTKL